MAILVPRVLPGVDFRKLPLDPTDGFVLTRIDGATTIAAIAQTTGLPEGSVASCVDKLKGLGVVDLIDPSKPLPAPPQERQERPKADVVRVASAGTAGRSQRYPDSELEEPCDIDLDHRKQILDLFYDLDDLDHYTLLGITPDADKKTVKRAYYDLASRLHPDRFFRRKLGSFKAKMEVVFAKVTTAHETLASTRNREEYDLYLRDVVSTRSLEAQLARAQEELKAAAEAEAEVQAVAQAQALAVAQAQALAQRVEQAPTPKQEADADLRARREALARRLGRPVAQAAPKPAEPSRQDHARWRSVEENRDTVKRMYDDRVNGFKRAQVKKYTDMAAEAGTKNDVVAVAAAYRMALSVDSTDEELRARYNAAEANAAVILVDTYLKNAQYEERNDKYADAARSWQKVAQIRPNDPVPAEAAARCLVASRGNLHQAADLAKRAITLAPTVIKYRLTLAKVYIAANLLLAAKRELDAAAKVEPKNQAISDLLKSLNARPA